MPSSPATSVRCVRTRKCASWSHACWWRLQYTTALLAIVSLVFFAGPSLCAQQPKASEFQVKAAYLYNFGKFVAWPDENGTGHAESFEICVLGTDPFGQALDATLAGGTIGEVKAAGAAPWRRKSAMAARTRAAKSSHIATPTRS